MLPKFRAVLYRGRYYAEWREGGQVRRKTLNTSDPYTASAALKAFVEAVEISNRPAQITVEFCWNGYRETLGAKSAAKTMGYEGKSILPFFGPSNAEEITEEDCREYRALRLRAGRRDGTVWTELGRLRSALRWAEKKRIIARAPAIYRPPMSAPRDLRLTREQAMAFLAACQMPHVRLFVILAMTTGARMGAILDLTWSRADFEGSLIDLNDPGRQKTKKGRALVPMNKTARAALSEARAGATTPYVIEWAGKRVLSVKRGLQAAGRRSGLPWVTAHVFRHSVASWLAQDGVPMGKIAEMLGHADSRTTERVYSRFTPDFLRDAAQALEIEFCGVVQCAGSHIERTPGKRNKVK
jgi:integrase